MTNDQTISEAAKLGLAAIKELMTEFVSKKRAANWDIINRGCIALERLSKTKVTP